MNKVRLTLQTILLRLLMDITRWPGVFLSFVRYTPGYIYHRLHLIFIYLINSLEVIAFQFGIIKQQIVSRMFWGRGTLYKNTFHIILTTFTIVLLAFGIISARILQVESQERSLSVNYGLSGNNDLLEQGGSLSTVYAVDDTNVNYSLARHTVQSGETLDSIAASYGVSKDTIRWANDKLISFFTDNIRVGWELYIPEVDGILYTVKADDNIDKVVAKTAGNKFDIIELNGLLPPGYVLSPGQRIFVPGGTMAPPPPPPPLFPARDNPGGGYVDSGVVVTAGLGGFPAGTLDDPLSHPSCAGYTHSRGYSGWHDGVDLSKGGGCPIRSIAPGTVMYAGWLEYGSGYTVAIDHGGGVVSRYLHGENNIWVKKGDYVLKGQNIMYMGSTGNSTGTHLHLTLKYFENTIDPAPYVPYRR